MANNKWTSDTFTQLRQGITVLIVADVLAGLSFLFGMLSGSNSFFLLLASIVALFGLRSLRAVFASMEDAPASVPSAKAVPADSILGDNTDDMDVIRRAARGGTTPVVAASASRVTARMSSPMRTSKAPQTPSWTENIDWEEWVGKKLLQKAGIVIVLIGMIVFLKYSFDNHWIDELGRIAMSAVGAVLLLGAGEWFHTKYANWSHAFTGGALALLYFTVWVSHVFYADALALKGLVLPASLALVLYSFITVVGIIAAVRYNAKTIAWFTVAGGYLTPFLIDAPAGSQLTLILYLAVLAGGMTLLAWHKRWRFIDTAAFALTQLYLFSIIYVAPKEFLPDAGQAVAAVGFFGLFTLLPLIRQFRLKMSVTEEDVGLIIANGATVFLAVVDAVGGWESGYVGLICLALAAFYLVCSAAALKQRAEDDRLVNMYVVGMIVLIAGALLAEMTKEWVAMGWAPLSALVMYGSVRLQRRGPWICAVLLLIGSLIFLTFNLPANNVVPHTMIHLFTSNWSIQSYVVFASVIVWQMLSKKLPETLMTTTRPVFQNYLHIVLALLLFTDVTIITSQMDFTVNVMWTIGYILFTVVAIGTFFFTESLVWFAAACIVQILSLVFIFGLGQSSGMNVVDHNAGALVLHPWGYLSVLTLLSTFLMLYVAEVKKNRFASGIPVRTLLTAVALAQVWVHVSVEITNARDLYDWSQLVWARALTFWWILFAFAAIATGMIRTSVVMRKAGVFLLVIPFLFNHFAILNGGADRMIESMVWTVLALALCIVGGRTKYEEMLKGGMILLAGAAGIDMFAHLGVSGAGLLRSSWWALAGLVTMIAGFVEQEQKLRQLSMVIFAATVLKLLIFDFSALETPVRIGASIATGLLMIAASYLYQRFDSMLSSKSS
jgi:hypothetical protein